MEKIEIKRIGRATARGRNDAGARRNDDLASAGCITYGIVMAAVSSVEPSHAAPHVVMLSDLPEHAAGQLASALATASNKAGRKMEALFTFIRSFQRSMQSKGDAPPESDEVTLVNALNPPPYSRRTAQHEQRRASCANRMHFR